MAPSLLGIGFTRDAFDVFVQSRDEPNWLRERRAAAWAKFEELPWPSQRDEEWMRTDIRLFRLDKFALPIEPSLGVQSSAAGSASAAAPDALLTRGVALGGQVTALDSRPHAARLNEKWVRRGVLFGSLDE